MGKDWIRKGEKETTDQKYKGGRNESKKTRRKKEEKMKVRIE